MSCEGACAHLHVRFAVARVRVRAKSILESVRDVRACGPFFDVRCAVARVRVRAKSILESVRDVRACGPF